MKVTGNEMWAAACVTAMSAGCGAQATPDYYGDSLGNAYGLVSNPESLDVEHARVIANWGTVGLMFGSAKTDADVQGTFPASFQLDFYEAPPAEYLFTPADEIYGKDLDVSPQSWTGTREALASARGEYYDPAHESRVAISHVLAVDDDADTKVLGGDTAHAIVYVESDIQPGSFGEAMFQGRPKAGYHVFEVARLDPSAVFDVMKCQSAADGVEAWKACGVRSPLRIADPDAKLDVRLVSDASTLDFPSTNVQWARYGEELADPNAPPNCDPNNEMTKFIPGCQ